MGERPSSFARSRQERSRQAAAARTALRHASRSQPRLRDRAPGGTPEVHPAVPDRRHRHRARQGAALPRGHAARAAALRGQGQPRPARAQGAGAGRRGFEIASTAELDLLLGLGVPAGRGVLLQPVKSRESIAYAAAKGVEWFVIDSVDEMRRSPRRSSPTPSCTCASRPPTSAATGRSPASSARARRDAREIVATAAKLRRRPRRRHLPRRLAVPQPGKLARRAGEGAQRCSTSCARPASSRACSTSAAAIRCAT